MLVCGIALFSTVTIRIDALKGLESCVIIPGKKSPV